MKKILIGIVVGMTLLLTFANAKKLDANDTWDERVVDDYHKVGSLLMYGTYSNREEYPDAEKYLLKALQWMKDEEMDMNSFRAADIYNSLGHIYGLTSDFSQFDNASELDKESTEKAMESLKQSIVYFEKSYKIKKKLLAGSNNYRDTTADTKSMLNDKKSLLKKLEKRLSTF